MTIGRSERRRCYVGKGRVLTLFDPWGNPLCTCPTKYSLQPYTGCSHGCLYCYVTAYVRFRGCRPKKDFLLRLAKDLEHADAEIPVSMSNSSDPYVPEEQKLMLTRRALELLLKRGFKVLIVTKGSIVERDAEVLARGNAAVTMTITTLDSSLSRRIEPNAPAPTDRLKALEKLHEAGIPIGVRIDPVIPYINDDPDELKELVDAASNVGARFVVTSSYKARPDNLARLKSAFPELADKLDKLYKINGRWFYGYWYLPEELRRKLLRPVIEAAKKKGMEYATCREGLRGPEWFKAGSCDGTHLIPRRITPKRTNRSLYQHCTK
ncbi:MAG: radical SAM protein [Thermoprotei archaeon]|nr:MAG: radical SAM protein [Thermoprotei archaeon]